MRRLAYFLPLLLFAAPSKAATVTAASCNFVDVNAVVNGPTHTAVDGDVIVIPPGSCNWSNSQLVVPASIGITIIGTGTQNSAPGVSGAGTINTSLTSARISMNPIFGNSLSRISTINFLPGTSAPINVNGTCTPSGCPNLRLDNLFFPTSWQNVAFSDQSVMNISNVFGVGDHNTCGDTANSSSYLACWNIGHGSWQGVGFWGDNSYATPLTFGTNQTFIIEDNIFNYSLGTDTDLSGSNGGGARFVCRFNTFNNININGMCSGHGTDTTGRARGVVQWEAYYNTGVCSNSSQGCGSAWPGRSGSGRSFSNTLTNSGSGFFKGMVDQNPQRRWRPDSPWGACDGTSPWDTNDTATGIAFSGTTGSTSNNGSVWTITDSGSPGWTTNQWNDGVHPYSYHNKVQSSSFTIASNTANTFLSQGMCIGGSCTTSSIPSGQGYEIRRANVCLDQPTRSNGLLVQGSPNPTLVSTGLAGAVNQVNTPTYEAADTLPNTADHTIGGAPAILANRDYYAEAVRQAAQTSPISPFNGSSGMGHGTLANRPATCTAGVGYWATDQGSWNVSTGPNAGKQGLLYVCGSGNSWSVAYTPFTYPHPLITGGSAVVPPNPPTSLTATASGASTINLSWTVPTSGFTGENVYRGTAHNGPYSLIRAGLTGNTFSNTGLAAGTYFYVATSFNGGIISSVSGSGTTATVTCVSPCAFPTNSSAIIQGVSVSGYNGTFTVTGQPTSTTFTYASSTTGSGTGGAAWISGAESVKSNEASAAVPATGTVSINPASLSYASRTVGTTSPSQTITFTNTSGPGISVTISSISMVGGNAGDFAQTNNCPASLPSGSSCGIFPTFSPTAPGARSTTLTIVDNATGSPHTVALSGTGVAATPIAQLTPSSHDFGSQLLSTTSTAFAFTLTNSGTGTLTVSSITPSGDFAVSSTVPSGGICGGSLAPAASCLINVTFTPTATGGRAGSFSVVDNAAGSPHVSTLSGTGITTKCQMTNTISLTGQAAFCQ